MQHQIALGLISYTPRRIDLKVAEETPDWAFVLWSLRQDDFRK
jgi:hypothetical protein